MGFEPKYSAAEVERLVARGGLGPLETYRLKHQHPLNQLTHVFGIPSVIASAAYPIYMWLAEDVLAWEAMLILGAIGWSLQFLGHAIEGNRPAFMEDPRHFLVGPAFILGMPFFWLYRLVTGRSFWSADSEEGQRE